MAGKISKEIRSYVLIFIGALMYALGWSIFILPHHMVSGGVSGIGAVIQYATGFKMSYTFALINGVLLAIALKILGGKFGIKTIYAVIVMTVLLRVLPEAIPADFIDSVAISNGRLLCAIIGGGISALGTAIMISCGGSSGGTDIIALLVSKYRDVPPGRTIMLLDVAIIASSLLIPSEGGWGSRVATVIYGYVIAGVFSFTLDHALQSNKQCVQLFIFSKNYINIADRINKEVNRGVSVISAEGWYSKSEIDVLMVIVRKTELDSITAIVKQEDPSAFTSVGSVMGVYGEGFEKMKK